MDPTNAERNPDSLRRYIALTACEHGKLLKEKNTKLSEKDSTIKGLEKKVNKLTSELKEKKEQLVKHELCRKQILDAVNQIEEECCSDCEATYMECYSCDTNICDNHTFVDWGRRYCAKCYDKV